MEDEASVPSMPELSMFDHAAEIETFRACCNRDADAFDILDLPANIWKSVYLGDVNGPESVTLTLLGNEIREFFTKDIRGMDLFHIPHGDEKSRVYESYRDMIADGTEFAIQQFTYLSDKKLNTQLECAALPLCSNGKAVKIIGILYVTPLPHQRDPDASFHKITF